METQLEAMRRRALWSEWRRKHGARGQYAMRISSAGSKRSVPRRWAENAVDLQAALMGAAVVTRGTGKAYFYVARDGARVDRAVRGPLGTNEFYRKCFNSQPGFTNIGKSHLRVSAWSLLGTTEPCQGVMLMITMIV